MKEQAYDDGFNDAKWHLNNHPQEQQRFRYKPDHPFFKWYIGGYNAGYADWRKSRA